MANQARELLETRRFELRASGLAQNEGQGGAISLPARPAKRRLGSPNQVLARTVEAEIIPRLFLALREASPAGDAEAHHKKPYGTEVDDFTHIILVEAPAEACAYVEKIRSRGLSLEQIYLDVIEPAARRLGSLWNADVCDFVAVTVGILRLQQTLHEFGLAFRAEVEPNEHGNRALLVPAPGEKDSFGHLMFGAFGLMMAAEFLRRDGWDAYLDSAASSSDTVGMVRREWFDVVEMSLTDERHLGELAAGIRQIRKASRNRSIGIIVSGPVFRDHPDKATYVGADAAAVDGKHASSQAEELMRLSKSK